MFFFRLNITSWACLLVCGLKIIFHWKALFFKSSLSSPADTLISWIAENKDASSANNLTLDDRLSNKSLISITNNNGHNIDTCGTPALTLAQVDIWPLRASLCFLLVKKVKMFNKSPKLSFYSSLKITPSCHNLSKALDLSKKTLLTSSPSSKDL